MGRRTAEPLGLKPFKHGTEYAYTHYGCHCKKCRKAHAEVKQKWREKKYAEMKDPHDQRHGTAEFYSNHGCRCDRCTLAHSNRCFDAAEKRRESIDPNDIRHGTPSFYTNHRCRCDRCKAARRKENSDRKAAREKAQP